MGKDPSKKGHSVIKGLRRLFEAAMAVSASKKRLARTIREMEEEKNILERQYDEVNRLNMELNRTMKHLLGVQDMARAILFILDLEQLLTRVMDIIKDMCKIQRIMILLKNEGAEVLEYAHGKGFPVEVAERIKDYRVSLDEPGNILAKVASTGVPEYITNMQASILGPDGDILDFQDNESLYVFPLISRSRVIGIIATNSAESDSTMEISSTLKTFAPQIAIAIENARLYESLQDQLEALDRSFTMLRRADRFAFLSNLSEKLANDIREPITEISRLIRMLPENMDDEGFRNSFHNTAFEGVNRVNNLISELLNLVRSKESQFEMVELHDLMEKTLLLISPHYHAKGVKIERKYDPMIDFVWIDAEKIRQAFLNIVSNAIDFTSSKGRIEISTMVHSGYQKQKNVVIKIKDDGIGISEDVLNKIFDPYFSTRNGDGQMGNGGLGLFLALKNIQDHGGIIDVESREGEGTTFTVNIPVDPPI